MEYELKSRTLSAFVCRAAICLPPFDGRDVLVWSESWIRTAGLRCICVLLVCRCRGAIEPSPHGKCCCLVRVPMPTSRRRRRRRLRPDTGAIVRGSTLSRENICYLPCSLAIMRSGTSQETRTWSLRPVSDPPAMMSSEEPNDRVLWQYSIRLAFVCRRELHAATAKLNSFSVDLWT